MTMAMCGRHDALVSTHMQFAKPMMPAHGPLQLTAKSILPYMGLYRSRRATKLHRLTLQCVTCGKASSSCMLWHSLTLRQLNGFSRVMMNDLVMESCIHSSMDRANSRVE